MQHNEGEFDPCILKRIPAVCPEFRPQNCATEQAQQCKTRTGNTLVQPYGALETLQDNLVSAPLHALARSNEHLILDTEACNKEVGCLLMQEYLDGTELPLRDWSRPLSTAEQNFDTLHQEGLAVFCPVWLLHPYFGSHKANIRTDNHAI